MSIPAPLPIVSVRDVLPTLGFAPDWAGYSENPPGFKFNRSNLELTAGEMTNRYLQRGVQFSGLWRTARSLKMIDFEMPLKAESHEQVVAWIVFGIGIDYEPPSAIDWFDQGKLWQDQLPWERYYRDLRVRIEETRRLRALRPHCFLSRKWMRVLLNHMAAATASNSQAVEVQVHFNGRMLTLEVGEEMIGAPASGPGAWPCKYGVAITADGVLPSRLMTDPVEVGIWQGAFEVESCRLRAAEF